MEKLHAFPVRARVVLAQGKDIVPIPGTKQRRYLDHNLAAEALILKRDELASIEAAFPKRVAAGTRYPESAMRALNG